MKILLDKDNATKDEMRNLFTHRKRGNLILPTGLINELDHYCQGCGKRHTEKQRMYFGQIFCAPCVEKWENGQR